MVVIVPSMGLYQCFEMQLGNYVIYLNWLHEACFQKVCFHWWTTPAQSPLQARRPRYDWLLMSGFKQAAYSEAWAQ